jgi:hypothetical protein
MDPSLREDLKYVLALMPEEERDDPAKILSAIEPNFPLKKRAFSEQDVAAALKELQRERKRARDLSRGE